MNRYDILRLYLRYKLVRLIKGWDQGFGHIQEEDDHEQIVANMASHWPALGGINTAAYCWSYNFV